MNRPPINSEETFGSLKSENAMLRKALELFWEGNEQVDSYMEDNDVATFPDNPTWKEIRKICHECNIRGNYVYDGYSHH